MENWRLEYLATQCLMALEHKGYEVRILQDFDKVPEAMDELGGRCSPILDPRRNLFTRTNALWMFAYYEGTPVLGGGVRVDDIGDEDLGSFILRSLPLAFGVRAKPVNYGIFDRKLFGRVGYFGDLKAEIPSHHWRIADDVIRSFTAYGHFRIMKDFGADCTYCYLRKKDKRRAENYGFLDTSPWIWELDGKMYKDGNPKWIGHLRRSLLPDLLLSSEDSVLNLLGKPDDFVRAGQCATNSEASKDVCEASV